MEGEFRCQENQNDAEERGEIHFTQAQGHPTQRREQVARGRIRKIPDGMVSQVDVAGEQVRKQKAGDELFQRQIRTDSHEQCLLQQLNR